MLGRKAIRTMVLNPDMKNLTRGGKYGWPNRRGFPGRIAFKVAFEEDSRMIIGENGADRLNGKGDFLFRDSTGLHRGQVPYISDEDFESLCAR